MTHNIILNHADKTIEITKTFAKAASIYGSNEYLKLKGAREDFPEYTVKVKTVAKRSIFLDITTEQIKNYLERKNDDDNLKNYNALVNGGASESQIRNWFVENNENIKKCKKKTDLILALIA